MWQQHQSVNIMNVFLMYLFVPNYNSVVFFIHEECFIITNSYSFKAFIHTMNRIIVTLVFAICMAFSANAFLAKSRYIQSITTRTSGKHYVNLFWYQNSPIQKIWYQPFFLVCCLFNYFISISVLAIWLFILFIC